MKISVRFLINLDVKIKKEKFIHDINPLILTEVS